MKIDLSSVVLGYILGPIAERGMVRTIIMEGSLGAAVMSIVTRPICIALIVISIVSLAVPIYNNWKGAKQTDSEYLLSK
ncbi:hypothetical protein [[Clostridium] symbiosum]|nr:hypothetical protein [[Clostridium] symbiosum]ERI78919.1 hypothetical protein CLOSYM_01221 [[Clostridium] symbiosum ATCC 14940]MDB2008984.1 hypothetical protein [[Clostridium] symbiosum]MDB2026318.1 hypothetical protein [[Clostridium] symbiosum]MDB2032886.1 hypothetical protein [[Clostridium] symbiosum]